MAESTIDVVIKLVQLVIITIILISFIWKRRNLQIRVLNWLLVIFSLSLIQGIMELIIYYVKTNILDLVEPSHYRLNELHSIPYGLAIVVIYIFAELMTNRYPNPFRFATVIFLWTSYITVLIYEISVDYALTFDQPASTMTYKSIFDLFQLVTMLFVAIIFWKSFAITKNAINKRASLYMFIAVVLYVLAAGYEIGQDLLGFPPVYGAITFGLTFLVLAYVYLKYPYFVFSSPTRIYRLMITSDTGIYLYSVQTDEEGTPDELLASAINSISYFIQEETGSDTQLETISTKDRTILLSPGSKVTGILVADKETGTLRYALNQFVREFESKFEKHLLSFAADISAFRDSINIVLQCFPYIESSDAIQFQLQSTTENT